MFAPGRRGLIDYLRTLGVDAGPVGGHPVKISYGRTAVDGGTAVWVGIMTFDNVRGVALVHRRRFLRSVSVEFHGPEHVLALEARWLPRLP